MHILIVEDEKNIRQELKILLENSLYQVTALEDFSDVAGSASDYSRSCALGFESS